MSLAFSARKNEPFKERVIKEKQWKAFLLMKKVTAALLKIFPDIGVKEYYLNSVLEAGTHQLENTLVTVKYVGNKPIMKNFYMAYICLLELLKPGKLHCFFRQLDR